MSQEKKCPIRGTNFNEIFFENFKKSLFYTELYKKHEDELIIGVRDGYINIYYNCDSIAKIKNTSVNPELITGELADYYLTGDNRILNYTSRSAQEILDNYEKIKSNSQKREKLEKQAQERVFIDNNLNDNSDWFCIDVEYAKSYIENKKVRGWRFDIIAISKKAPYRVALIELKYGRNAIGGDSGINEHIKDYYEFHTNGSFKILKPELISIIESLIKIGVDVPETLHGIRMEEFFSKPEYYFITLNNNKSGEKGATPMETMAGYLFTKDNAPKDWKAKKYSKDASENGYHSVVKGDKSFEPVFLFSEATLPNLGIINILDERYYTKKIIN